MKKLFILAILTVNVLKINGQSRKCDIKTLIPNYNFNDTFYSPDTLDFKFFVVNQGPDSIKKGDLFGVSAQLTNVHFEYTFPRIAKDLGVGDTGVLSTRMVLNFTKTLFDIDFCMYAELGIMANGAYFVKETDQEKKDNTFCTKVNHITRISSTEINSQLISESINPYPNPCNDFLNIANQPESELLSVKDIFGKTYHLKSEKTDNNLIVNTSELNPGLYVISFKINDELKQFKVVKI